MKIEIALGLSIFVLSVAGPNTGTGQSYAQTAPTLTTEASRMDQLAANQGEPKVIEKISGAFGSFLGSDSHAVVTGLRNGAPITLTRTTPSGTPGAAPVTTTATITPPTGKMGFGNVFISLALAKQELSQRGIAKPTPEQLRAALLGGSITAGSGATATSTNLQGILTLRSQNMGWGQIAQKLGSKLGPVVSGLKTANHNLALRGTSSADSGIVNTGGQPVGTSESGVVTGGGKSVGQSGKGVTGKGDGGEGIVTGSGRSVGSTGGITTGGGHAYGLSGGSAGQGKGQGK